jgi:predicted anti-sigma-YlaC factor YlaD
MTCKEVKKNLIFYHYGEIDKQKAKEIKEHLQNCKSCAAEYQKLQLALNYMDAEAKTQANPFIWTRIKARLEQAEQYQPLPKWVRVLQPVLLVILVVVGLFLGIQLGKLYTIPESKYVAIAELEEQGLFVSIDQIDSPIILINN